MLENVCPLEGFVHYQYTEGLAPPAVDGFPSISW